MITNTPVHPVNFSSRIIYFSAVLITAFQD